MQKIIILLSLLTTMLTATQAQNHPERLRAKVYLRYNNERWQVVDSTVYGYRAGRGGISTEAREAAMFERYSNFVFDTNHYRPATIIVDTFDAAGHKVSSTWQQYRGGIWHPSQRFEYSYNAQGDTTARWLYMWYPVDKAWSPYSHNVINYDAAGRRVADLCQQLNNNGIYGNFTLDSLRYDSLGRRSAAIHLLWDSARWQYRTANFYGYDAYNRRNRDMTMTASLTGWQKYSLDSFSYDGQDSLLSETTSRWLERPRGWKVVFQHLYQYDDQHSRALITHHEFNLENDTVGGTIVDSLAYGEHHRIEALYHLNPDEGKMVPGSADQYEYNSKQRLIAVVSSVSIDGKWQPISRADYQYDALGYRTSYTLSSYTDGRWLPELSEHQYFEAVK